MVRHLARWGEQQGRRIPEGGAPPGPVRSIYIVQPARPNISRCADSHPCFRVLIKDAAHQAGAAGAGGGPEGAVHWHLADAKRSLENSNELHRAAPLLLAPDKAQATATGGNPSRAVLFLA